MMKMRFMLWLCLWAVMPLQSYAWGPLGHQVVCDIAWRESSKSIRKQLSSAAKRVGYKTYAQSCVWADHIRGREKYDYLKQYHYANVARKAAAVKKAPCLKYYRNGSEPSCVLTAIPYYQQRITDRRLDQRQRDEALLLLGHFVGDIHQPLHISYQDDLGGNRRTVIFAGKLTNLHAVWDNDIVYCGLKGRVNWKFLGKQLTAQKAPAQKTLVQKVIDRSHVKDVQHWADESLNHTRRIYKRLSDSKKLPASYCEDYHSLALERIHLAGLRLAQLLEKQLLEKR